MLKEEGRGARSVGGGTLLIEVAVGFGRVTVVVVGVRLPVR